MLKEKKFMKRKKILILLIGVLLVTLTGCENNQNSNTTNDSNNNNASYNENNDSYNNSTNDATNSKSNKYSLGDTFNFDGLELTLDTTYSFVTVKNKYSEHNGKSVIKIGVNVKNVSSEKNHLNMFYYDLFGSKGQELDSITSYFDDTIDYGGDLKPNASYKKFFYILYDGDGEYSIDFDNYSQELSVEFNISKQ